LFRNLWPFPSLHNSRDNHLLNDRQGDIKHVRYAEHCAKECPKRESTKPQISKSKKRRERYHTLIRQKDVIINQQKFLIDDMAKDIKRLTEEISKLKFESLYYEP